MNVSNIRKDFPILSRKINGKPLVYLDSAATSQKPRQVIDAIKTHLETSNANVHRGIHTLTVEATEAYDKARKKIADFVGVKDSSEIIFVRNTSEAINLVAYSWGRLNIGKGDEIVLTIAEHHSNIVPWQQLATENGAVLKFVPIENGELDIKAFERALTKKTKLVTFAHVSNILGTIFPVEKLVKLVRDQRPEIRIFIDGAQAVPHMKVDIPKIGCDFYAFSGHKMLGPSGIGVLWGRRKILGKMPPFLFGGDMISTVKVDESEWAELPLKFEAGTPNIEGAIGLGAAVDYLKEIGMENVRKHEVELTKYALDELAKIPEVTIYGPLNSVIARSPSTSLRTTKQSKKRSLRYPRDDNRAGVISFNIGSIPAHDVATIMDSEGVEIRSGFNCAEPLADFLGTGPLARASFYIYNDKSDVDRLILGLRKVQEVFGRVGKWDGRRKNKNDNLHTHHPIILST